MHLTDSDLEHLDEEIKQMSEAELRALFPKLLEDLTETMELLKRSEPSVSNPPS